MASKVVAVFGSSTAQRGQPLYEEALLCGRLLAEAGFVVKTGGYGGVMEAASRGAREVGGSTIGVTAPKVFPDRAGANLYVGEERQVPGPMERFDELIGRSHAAITMPGSIGTFAELIVAWNVAYLAPLSGNEPKPLVAVGERWRRLVPSLAALLDTDGDLVVCVDTVGEAVDVVRNRLGVSRW